MDAIFNFFGSILGYILWFFYYIVGNYGVAIILFTILFKVILFPLSVKQQKSMAVTSRIAEKQKELSKKYANDKRKYQEEVQKLYAKARRRLFDYSFAISTYDWSLLHNFKSFTKCAAFIQ